MGKNEWGLSIMVGVYHRMLSIKKVTNILICFLDYNRECIIRNVIYKGKVPMELSLEEY